MRALCKSYWLWTRRRKTGDVIWIWSTLHTVCGNGLSTRVPQPTSSKLEPRTMNNVADVQPDIGSGLPPSLSGGGSWQGLVSEAELARFVPHLDLMSRQLRQTSQQIESSVVDVCNSFEGIAARARSTVARTGGFLSGNGMGPSTDRKREVRRDGKE